MSKPAHKTTDIAKTSASDAGLPAFMQGKVHQDAGKGVSTDQADNLVPLIYILQAQSPQVNKKNPAYVQGAEYGDIWLRQNSASPVVKGDTGILFQPCYFEKYYAEWIPRDNGGGFVARHESLPEVAKKQEDPKNPNKIKHVMPNGNELIETRAHIGYVYLPNGQHYPYVIPMTSSGHTVSRAWTFSMNSKLVGQDKAPSWACLYRLKTKERTNAAGTWATWDVSDAGWVQSEADYNRGKALHEAFASGDKQSEAPVVVEEVADDGTM